MKLDIQATFFALASKGGDRLVWAASSHGNFDLKSAYKLSKTKKDHQEFLGGWIWKVNIIPKIQYFIWKCFHNSIGVKECLVKKGVLQDPICPICNCAHESILHALRDC